MLVFKRAKQRKEESRDTKVRSAWVTYLLAQHCWILISNPHNTVPAQIDVLFTIFSSINRNIPTLSMKKFKSWSRKILSWPVESRICLPDGQCFWGDRLRPAHESVTMSTFTRATHTQLLQSHRCHDYSFRVNDSHDYAYKLSTANWIDGDIPSSCSPTATVLYSIPLDAATALISCAQSGSLGCLSIKDLLCVRFVTSSPGVIYGSHTGHSCELFISGEDKGKSQLYYPDGVGLYTQQTGLTGELQQACITHIWSGFSEAMKCPPCVQTNAAQVWCALNTKWYLCEHNFYYCLLLMLISRHLTLLIHLEITLCFTYLLRANTLLGSDVLFETEESLKSIWRIHVLVCSPCMSSLSSLPCGCNLKTVCL